MAAFANRLLGSFWIMIGVLIGVVAALYMLFFERISTTAAGLLGANTPIINFLTSRFGPGYLNWWGLGLAIFLVLLGVRLLALAPVARPVAMAFHLLGGLFFLTITMVLLLALSELGGLLLPMAQGAGQIVLIVGLGLGVLMLAIGAALGSKQAWDGFTTGGGAGIVGGRPADAGDASSGHTARLINHTTNDSYPLKASAGRITIGADSSQAIVLDDPTVSRSHAFIEYINGDFLLADNNSTNGTFLNDKRVAVLQETLRPGDEVRLGNVRLTFE